MGKIAFNYDDANMWEIDTKAKHICKKVGLLYEYMSLNVYFFGAAKERDEVADMFLSDWAIRKMERTLLYITRHCKIKVTMGMGDRASKGEGNWIAFSRRMREQRIDDCVKIILCMVYEANGLLKTDREEREVPQCAG